MVLFESMKYDFNLPIAPANPSVAFGIDGNVIEHWDAHPSLPLILPRAACTLKLPLWRSGWLLQKHCDSGA